MQMSENDLEGTSIKKSPVYILFLFIVSAQAFLGIFYDKTWPVRGTNKNQSALVLTAMTNVGFIAFILINKEELMKWHPSGVTRARIPSYWDIVQWIGDQGNGNLVQVSGEFELSEFS